MILHSSPTIRKDDLDCVEKSLKDRKLASGEISSLFVEELKKFFDAKAVILTSSGTMAIVQALKLLNLKEEDNVIIPAYVCDSVAKGVLMAGAKPLIVDINRDDYNISYEDTIRKVSKNTKAIILPSVFGNTVRNINAFLEMGIIVIEDVAQSIGGKFKEKRLGSFGDMSVCSFYATKMITTGEGGALIINSNKLSKKINEKRESFKMTDFQSALGLNQLRKIDALIKSRKKIADQYIEGLRKLSRIKLSMPKDTIYYRFIIEAGENTEKIIKEFDVLGIKVARFTELVLNFLKLDVNEYPNTKEAIRSVLSLPIYPTLSSKNVHYIIKCFKRITKRWK